MGMEPPSVAPCRVPSMETVLHAVPELPRPGVWVGSGLGFGRMSHVASASGSLHRLVFRVRVLVVVKGSSRGAMASGAEGQEGYECRVDNISQRCYSITKLIYFCVRRGLLYNVADYRAGKKTAQTTRGHVCHDTLACVCGCA